jgi:hypothetical protein
VLFAFAARDIFCEVTSLPALQSGSEVWKHKIVAKLMNRIIFNVLINSVPFQISKIIFGALNFILQYTGYF